MQGDLRLAGAERPHQLRGLPGARTGECLGGGVIEHEAERAFWDAAPTRARMVNGSPCGAYQAPVTLKRLLRVMAVGVD
jgi:hypothetical protein